MGRDSRGDLPLKGFCKAEILHDESRSYFESVTVGDEERVKWQSKSYETAFYVFV